VSRENFPGPEIFSIGSPKIGNYGHIFFNPYNPSVSLCVCSMEKAQTFVAGLSYEEFLSILL
ncbi:MAG: hypothetical protein DRI57_02545, partial [Deltaproteobacteria bacterium]